MQKSDKELVVELVCAYIGAWFSRQQTMAPMTGEMLQSLVKDAWAAIHALPDGSADSVDGM